MCYMYNGFSSIPSSYIYLFVPIYQKYMTSDINKIYEELNDLIMALMCLILSLYAGLYCIQKFK